MTRVWILLDLVVYMYISQSRVIASKYYVSNQAVTRSEAAKNCTLATPKIDYTPDGELVTLELDLDLGGHDKLWVGYTLDYQVFRYIGCVPEGAVTSEARFTMKQDIGLCYSACSATEYKYFGVKVTDGASNSIVCTCINDYLEQAVTSCDIDSEDQGEFSFGGVSTMALYTLASPAPVFTYNNRSWNDRTTNCFSFFDPTFLVFMWNACHRTYGFMCSSTGGIDKKTQPSYDTWKKAAEMCSGRGQYMPLYHENIGQINGSPPLWMSYIKAMSISSTKGQTPSEHIRYGYIKKVNGTFVLEFSKDGNMIKALCSKEDSSLDDTTDTNTEARSSNVGVYVGVSVVIILVAVASVIAIVIWKRRQRPVDIKEKVDNSTGNPAYQHSDTVVDSHLNNTGNLDSLAEPNGSDSYQTLAVVGDGNGLYDSLAEPNGSDSYQTLAVVGDGDRLYDSLTEPNGSDSYQTLARVGDGKTQ